MQKINSLFEDPTCEYRGKPFWAWNGLLNKEELIRQVGVFKEMGFGGYFMHSRTGLATPYLGEEWFDCINACADEGQRLGMESWLYDEDRWPSGTAGGIVTQNSEYSIRYIRYERHKGCDFAFAPRHIAVFACELDGVSFWGECCITPETPKAEYSGRDILAFSVEVMGASSFYNGSTYVDTMNPEATQSFIKVTHERYKAHCGERLGTSIRGIFTDEPHHGGVMCGFSLPGEDTLNLTPCPKNLFEAFEDEYGYDLLSRLPELFLFRRGEKVSQVKWHYMNLIAQLFIDHFMKPINSWCFDHRLILTGHALHEDALTSQALMAGSIQRVYEHLGYPGVDVLTEYNRNYWVVKQLSSVGRQLGKKWLLSELYGGTGWQMKFEDYKWAGDWQALFGINLRCPHLSWYTMQGEAKRDFPASMFYQSAWYRDYKLVEDYYSRLHVVLAVGQPVCDVLVINPVESMYTMIHPGWADFLYADTPEGTALEEMYNQMFHWLTSSQIDFDYGDEEMMSRHCSIVQGDDGRTAIQFADMVYHTVVVAGMVTMRSSTVRLLDAFMAKGGVVIVAGDAPNYVDAKKSGAFDAAGRAARVAFNRDEVVSAVVASSPPLVELYGPGGMALPDIFGQMRKDGDEYYLVLMNMSRDTAYSNVHVRLNLPGVVEEWHCTDGSKTLPLICSDGQRIICTDFYPAGERVFVVKESTELSPAPKAEVYKAQTLGRTYSVALSEPNILVLDRAVYEINGEKTGEEAEILRVDQRIRDAFGLEYRGGEMVQPWFAGQKSAVCYGKIALEFEFFAETVPTSAVLVAEEPQRFGITLNGCAVDTGKSDGYFIDPAFVKLPLPENVLALGRNVFRLEADFCEEMNIEALHLIGDFGVRLDGIRKTLTAPVCQAEVGDIAGQGLPFYSGGITYKTEITHAGAPGQQVFVTLPGYGAALVKVSVNGAVPKPIIWQPYEVEVTDMLREGTNELTLEYVLTRRNTFGPLHLKERCRIRGYGPDSFVEDGANYTDEYTLIPNGMTSAPVLAYKTMRG